MDEARKELTRKLKGYCKPSMRALCSAVGLTEGDTDIMLMSFCEDRADDYIAHEMNMSRSSYHQRKQKILGRILDYKRHLSGL